MEYNFHKKKLFLAFTLAMSGLTLSAQTKIEGVFKDSVKNVVEPYATIRIFRKGKMEKPIALSLTGENGEINQIIEGTGNFILSISSVGKKEVRRQLSVNGEPAIQLGDICTADDINQLSNVEVVSYKPVVKIDTDKMTYSVKDDADSQFMTVLDMLRKVPMVIVDAEDNITVKGSSQFKILVDGKPNVQLQSDAQQILKTIPANMVEKIEVITNPGAKYDAEGVSSVLNFIFHHDGGNCDQANAKGYNDDVSVRVGNRGEVASFYIAGQNRKLTYNIDIFGGVNKIKGYDVDEERDLFGESNAHISTKEHANQIGTYAGGTFSIGYNIDSLDVINASVGFDYTRVKIDGNTAMDIDGFAYGSGLAYKFDGIYKDRSISADAGIDWQHFFNGDHTHSLTLSYLFDNSPDRQKDYKYYKSFTGDPQYKLNDSYSDNYTNATEHTLQLDYTFPVSEGQTLNAGAKYLLRLNHADADAYYNLLDTGGSDTAPETMSVYDNRQQIVASYIEHEGTYGKWGSREGVRYEHTWECLDFPENKEQNFKKNYGNIVPSISVSYNFSQNTNLSLSYTMRLKRPGISYMNPYRDPYDATSLIYGNPELNVEKANYIDLTFGHYGGNFMFNATLSQCLCNNQIASYCFIDADGILNTTYGNHVRNRWTNFNTWMKVIAGKNTSITLNGYLGYGDMRSEQIDMCNHGWQASAMLMLEQKLPWKLKCNFGTQAASRTYSLQGYESGAAIVFLRLHRSFFKDKLKVSVSGMTPYTGMLKLNEYKHNSQFAENHGRHVDVKNFWINLSWKFGNTNKQFSKHESKINNEFSEGESSSNGGVNTNM